MFGAVPGPQESTQDGPRSPQDGSKIVLDRFFHLLIFRFDFVSFSVPFWCRFGLPNGPPGVSANWGWAPWGRSKTVLKSSWFGSLVVLSFGIAFLVVLGSFWGRFWALRGSFWCFFGSSTHRFNPSTHQLVDSTHQLINLSTHQPMAPRHFLTRPGGLRAARLNKIKSTGNWKTTGHQPGTNNRANRATSSTGRSVKPSLGCQEKAFKTVNRATGPTGPGAARLASRGQMNLYEIYTLLDK